MIEVGEERTDARLRLAATSDGREVLAILCHQHAPDVLGIGIPQIAEPALAEPALDAVAAWLAGHNRKRATTLVSWEKPERDQLHQSLERAGYAVHRRKLFVGRDLVNDPPASPPLSSTFLSLAETGRTRFIAAMAACGSGDPFAEEGADPEQEFDNLVEYAGEAFDPTLWLIALDASGTVGVLLPQLYHDRPNEGTLFYIGVAPERRGEGWGAMLHAHGLALLARRGATRYVGSTDLRNEPMARIFQRNRCTRRGEQVLYRSEV